MIKETRKTVMEYLIRADFFTHKKIKIRFQPKFTRGPFVSMQVKLFTTSELIKSYLIVAAEECVQRK